MKEEGYELVPDISLGDAAGKQGWEEQGWVDRFSQPLYGQVLACNGNLF